MSDMLDRNLGMPLPEDPTLPHPGNTTVRSDFGTSLSNAVRDNPASAALIGVGVAWLFFGGSKTSLFGRKSQDDDFRRGRSHDDEMRFPPAASQPRYVDRFGGTASRGAAVRDVAGSINTGVQHAGSGLAEGASTMAAAASDGYEAVTTYAGDAASYLGHNAYDATRAGSRYVRSQAGHVQQTVGDFFEDQPIALGVLGLALGAGVAALLPKTEIERDYLGEASDALKGQARSLAGEKLEEAKELATTAFDGVSREAEAQGLTKAAAKDAAAELKAHVASVGSAAQVSIKSEANKAR